MIYEKPILEFIRNQVEGAKKDGVVVGVSGGVDSAVVATLCVKALGKEKVHGLIVPNYNTTLNDIDDATDICKKLQINYKLILISGVIEYLQEFNLKYLDIHNRIANGNLVARIRMTILYYYANGKNLLVAGTGDKSEHFIGYFTKYGDGGTDFEPIAHLLKSEVRELALQLGIPESIANKPSSPRLWPGQIAEEELGVTYDEIDKIIKMYESNIFSDGLSLDIDPRKVHKVLEMHLLSGLSLDIDPRKVHKVLEMHLLSNHKRRVPPSL